MMDDDSGEGRNCSLSFTRSRCGDNRLYVQIEGYDSNTTGRYRAVWSTVAR